LFLKKNTHPVSAKLIQLHKYGDHRILHPTLIRNSILSFIPMLSYRRLLLKRILEHFGVVREYSPAIHRAQLFKTSKFKNTSIIVLLSEKNEEDWNTERLFITNATLREVLGSDVKINLLNGNIIANGPPRKVLRSNESFSDPEFELQNLDFKIPGCRFYDIDPVQYTPIGSGLIPVFKVILKDDLRNRYQKHWFTFAGWFTMQKIAIFRHWSIELAKLLSRKIEIESNINQYSSAFKRDWYNEKTKMLSNHRAALQLREINRHVAPPPPAVGEIEHVELEEENELLEYQDGLIKNLSTKKSRYRRWKPQRDCSDVIDTHYELLSQYSEANAIVRQ
jgi:hypothetical protein